MYALVNCDVFSGNQLLYDKAVIIKGNKIDSIISVNDVGDKIEKKDLKGLSVAPGFIDIQVNGGGGVLFNDSPSIESIKAIHSAHMKFGTTDIMPTLITDSMEKMQDAISSVESAICNNMSGVLGIHLEGPVINLKKAGVHDKSFIKESQVFDYNMIKPKGAGKILFTVAPEEASAEVLRELKSKHVLLAAGHSNATYDEAISGFSNGISLVTHLFNAMSPFDSREPGMVGAALDSDDVWCNIIADGFHVHFSSFRVAWKAKKLGKMFLVTDAMPPVGAKNTKFRLGAYDIDVDNGRCVTKDGILAGSALDMATAVRNCIQKIGIARDESLRMASTYPAQFLGLDDRLGFIKEGYQANLTIFNNQIQIDAVIISGEYIKV